MAKKYSLKPEAEAVFEKIDKAHTQVASVAESANQFIARKKNADAILAVSVKDIGRKGRHYFNREAWTFMQQSNNPEKVFVVERFRKTKYEGELVNLQNWKEGEIEYRIGYFIVGKIGRTAGKWLWGQYCALIPQEDLQRLLNLAMNEGTLLSAP